MSFGVTVDGFKGKRLEDIQNEMKKDIVDVFGENVNFDPRGPWGQLLGIWSAKHSEIWELAEATYNAAYPATAEGVNLDNVASITGIVRKGATKSTAVITALGTPGTLIPSGQIVSVLGNPTAKFVTIEDKTILAQTNEVQKIFFSSVPTGGTWSLNFNGQLTSALAFNANAAAVEAALEALSNLTSVTVSGNYASGFTITFDGVDGNQNQPALVVNTNTLVNGLFGVTIQIQENTKGRPDSVDIKCEAQTAGATAAPAGTITVIETPVFGWASVTNELDAEIGRNIESDSELKTRRAQTVAFPGKATLDAIRADLLELEGVVAVFAEENTSIIPFGGLPPKSKHFVVQGGVNAEIAQTLWDNKAGGIQLVGATSEVVKDTQGFDQTVYFDRPTLVPIYIDLVITKDAKFPIDGATQIRNAVLAFGESLNIGDDVIVYPQLICAFDQVVGIKDVVIKIGIAPGPTLDDNISIDSDERADFDASRISVAVIT